MFCQQDFVSEQTCETAADDLRLLDLWPPDVGSFRSTKDRIFLTNPLSPMSLVAVAPLLPPLLLVFRRVKLKLVENFDLPFDGV